MFSPADLALASALLTRLRLKRLKLATAESCTGGLIVGLLTELPGSSDVVDRGLVTYSNAAKCELLDVPATLIGRYGAVSAEVATAMVSGALRNSTADLAVAVTGVAGPGGGTPAKPIGLVYLAAQVRNFSPHTLELRLGVVGRHMVRLETIRSALNLCNQALDSVPDVGVAGAGAP